MENVEKSKQKLPKVMFVEEIKPKVTQYSSVDVNKRKLAQVPSGEENKQNSPQILSIEESPEKLTLNLDCENLFRDQFEVERILIEHETIKLSLLDLLHELWNPTFFATRNLRLVLGCISKYIANQQSIGPTTVRMHEASSLKVTIVQLHGLCLQKGQINPKCSVEEMHMFIRHQVPRWLYEKVVKGLMSEDIFDEWVKDYKQYITNLPDSSKGSSVSRQTPVIDITDEGNVRRGLDTLFESVTEQSNEFMSQHVMKLENGRLFSLKTPGEIGFQLVRLFLYDVKDISHKDKRNWWRHAKVRTQFLLSHNDRKQQLLRQLLDEAADDLKKIPGNLKEVKNIGDGVSD